MGRVVKIASIAAGVLIALVALVGFIGYTVAGATAERKLSQVHSTHEVDFPVPFPLTESEIAELREERRAAMGAEIAADTDGPAAPDPLDGVDLDAIALERALARGKHYISSRYGCVECHGQDFGGGVMVDDPPVGVLHGPNLTGGKGSRIDAFTVADWDRIVRHGIQLGGTPAVMPSIDFFAMSDQELSDIIAYIRSLPKVDRETQPVSLGPILKILVATGQFQTSADLLPDHSREHPRFPPPESDTLAFGGHIAQTCAGCHNAELTGGPVPGAPPDWAPASNLTRLADWSFEEFEAVLRQGIRRDGTPVRTPMDKAVVGTRNLTDTEMRAVFAYLQSLAK